MKAQFMYPAVLALIVAFSCVDERVNEVTEPLEESEEAKGTLSTDSTFQECDSVYVANFHGTACCVSGPTVAKPGDILQYHYQMNHRDPEITWLIVEGDMTIVAGQDTHTVTVEFGPNFTTGLLLGSGKGIKYEDTPRLLCNDKAIVVNE